MIPPMLSVIATKNRSQLLDRTLASIARAPHPDGYKGALVIENGSRSGAEAVSGKWNQIFPVSYIHLSRPSKSAALNTALSVTEEGLLYFHDDDVELHPDALMAVASAASEARARSFFGGPLEANYEQTPPPWLIRYLPPSARGWRPTSEEIEDGNGLCYLGANWAALASDLRAVGGFDEEFGPSELAPGEETLIQKRLLESGATSRYVPGALVFHYVPRERCSPLWALKRAYRHGAARVAQRSVTETGAPPEHVVRRVARRFATDVGSVGDMWRLAFHALLVAAERGGAAHGKLRRRPERPKRTEGSLQ